MTAKLSSEFFTDGDQDVKRMMEDAWEKNSTANQTYWLEGTKDVRFKVGDQYLSNEIYASSPHDNRRKFNFNRIRKIINMVSGHQRRTRKTTEVYPVEGSDEDTANQFTKLLKWANQEQEVYHLLSEAFEGALTTGMNLISTWMDYRTDPLNGEIKFTNLSYNGFMIDQFFRKPDLSDANFIWTRKVLSKKVAISMFPGRKQEILEMAGSRKDDKFNFMPENINMQNPDLLSLDEFWHTDYRDIQLIVDSETGETMEWTGDNQSLKEFRKQFPQVTMKRTEKQTVKLAILLQNRVMFDGPNPFGIDKYPFVPVFGYFEPDMPYYEAKIQGMVRGLRDAQFLYNHRKVIELDILESQINSGKKVMENSLVDNDDAYKAGQGHVVTIKEDAPLGMASVETIPPPQIPPSMFQLSEQLSQEINQISGVNEELLGSADDDKAGILSMLRQGAGLTTLQIFFDNLDRSQKYLGELTLSLIQANFSPGKVARIIEEQPTAQFYTKSFQKFDAVVAEGMLTETQRKATFITLLEMQKLGLPIPVEELLEKANIPDKKDLIEKIQQQQKQAAEQQQKTEQLQMAQLQAQIKLADTQSAANVGLAKERDSRVLSNIGLAQERRAESIKDLEQATLDKIKAVKELQGIDLDQLQKAIDIIQAVKVQEVQDPTGERTIEGAVR